MHICKKWTEENQARRKPSSRVRNSTTARDDRHLIRMAGTDRTAFSRVLAQRWSTATYNNGRVRVRRYRGERLLPQCVIQLHTAHTLGIMVWGAIGYNVRSRLVHIAGNFNSDRYIREVMKPEVLPLLGAFRVLYFSRIIPVHMFLGLHKTSSVHNRLHFFHVSIFPGCVSHRACLGFHWSATCSYSRWGTQYE